MTPDLLACVDRTLAAEQAGDFSAALEWHRAVPMFRHGRHRAILERLVHLGDDLPAWLWVRWIAYLATRCEDGETGHLVRNQLHELVHTAHVDLLEDCYRRNGDPIKVAGTVMGESWLYHQVVAHEAGGIVGFLDEFATGPLAEHADLARQWAGARMSGYQLGESLPGARLRVREHQRTEWVEILDLGAWSCAGPPGWVVGRLVPSGSGPLMFDRSPLAVSEVVAGELAAAENWRDVISGVLRSGVAADFLLREDYELATDVQELDLVRFGTARGDLARVMHELRSGRDEGSRAAYRILRRAQEQELDAEEQAYVAAAVQFPKAHADARRQLVRPGDHDLWAAWAARVPAPARRQLMVLAESARASA